MKTLVLLTTMVDVFSLYFYIIYCYRVNKTIVHVHGLFSLLFLMYMYCTMINTDDGSTAMYCAQDDGTIGSGHMLCVLYCVHMAVVCIEHNIGMWFHCNLRQGSFRHFTHFN